MSSSERRDDDTVETVLIADLSVSDSPRLDGENEDHIRRLVETDDPLPPILVHRPTMLVIDGMHRLRAAQIRGKNEIAVTFVSCEPSEIFVQAVKANVAHGLPLSLADRKAAAARIVTSHPQWSDRAIAGATGLAHKTVGKIRHDLPGGVANSNLRVGQDGHTRPVRNYGRAVAEEIISRHPETSLRQVARAAGISVSTAHDVRRAMERSADPANASARSSVDANVLSSERLTAVMQTLRADPSLRFTNSGRALLRLLGSHRLAEDEWRQLVDCVPVHWASAVADLAREYSTAWQAFAARLDETTQQSTSVST